MMTTKNGTSRDHAFWEQAYTTFYRRLFSYARTLVNGRYYDAEDLMQETVYRALTYGRNPEEISNPLVYLLRTMRNVWIDMRGHKHMESLDELLDDEDLQRQLPSIEPEVLRILENRDLQNEISFKLGPLNHREKKLLDLHLGGYSCKEIADILNEDMRLTRSDLNAVVTKVRYRVRRMQKQRPS